MLRCKCKHKAKDHDCSKPPYACTKPNCKCKAFFSPWVCNCGHPWQDHKQSAVKKTVVLVDGVVVPKQIAEEVNNYELLKRGEAMVGV